MYQKSPGTQGELQTQPGTGPVEWHDIFENYSCRFCAYHSENTSRFLHPEGLDNLEDVHHSLSLAALNSSDYGTEHARTAHCVTAWEAE